MWWLQDLNLVWFSGPQLSPRAVLCSAAGELAGVYRSGCGGDPQSGAGLGGWWVIWSQSSVRRPPGRREPGRDSGRGRLAVGARPIVLSVEALLMGRPSRDKAEGRGRRGGNCLRGYRCDVGSRADPAAGGRACRRDSWAGEGLREGTTTCHIERTRVPEVTQSPGCEGCDHRCHSRHPDAETMCVLMVTRERWVSSRLPSYRISADSWSTRSCSEVTPGTVAEGQACCLAPGSGGRSPHAHPHHRACSRLPRVIPRGGWVIARRRIALPASLCETLPWPHRQVDVIT